MKKEVSENASSVENTTNSTGIQPETTNLETVNNINANQNEVNNETVNMPTESTVNNSTEVQNATPVESTVNVEMPSQNPTMTTNSVTAAGVAKTTGGIAAKIASFGIVPIVAAVAVVVLIIAGISVKTVTSSPKAVFKSAINKTYKEVNNYLKEYDKAQEKFSLNEKAMNFTGDIKFETNIEEFESEDFNVSDYKIGFDIGIDPKKEKMLVGGSLNGNDASIDAKLHIEEEKIYLTSSAIDEPIDFTEIASDLGIDLSELSTYYEEFSESAEIETADYQYIVKTFKDALIKTLDSKKMTKSNGKFEVDGKNVSATKISYELDEDTITETIKSMCEQLLEDDEFISKVSKMFDIEKSDLKDGIKELKSSANDIELEESIFLNIYIKGLLNEVVGLSIEIDEDEYVSFYKNNKTTELIVDNHVKEDSYYSSKMKLVITAVETNKETEVTVKYNGDKYASLTIREMAEDKIDLDYNITIPDEDTYKGTLYLTCEEKKETITGEYKFKLEIEDEYVTVSGNYTFAAKDSLDSVNGDDAISVDDVDFDELKENLNEKVENDETLSSLVDEAISSIEESTLDLNSIDMVEVTEEEAIEKLKNNKATVLYVGKTYYYYSESDARSILSNLMSLQTELEFYSFNLSPSYATTKFFEEVKDVPSNCDVTTETNTDSTENTETDGTNTDNTDQVQDTTTQTTSTCADTPAIYLIKDGKVVKAIKGSTTKSELQAALAEIGIK